MTQYRRLRLILGDQLNSRHSWYEQVAEDTLYVIMECRSETDYVEHHIQKVVAFFLAMRHFADHLRAHGHAVHYLQLDDSDNRQSITDNLAWLAEHYRAACIEYQLPDEYRLDKALRDFADRSDLEVTAVDSEHFLSSRSAVEEQFKGKKQYLLEAFYRKMRKQYNILMEDDGDTPLTGRWNYDAENRKKLPKDHEVPAPKVFARQVQEVIDMVKNQDVATIGTIDPDRFTYPVTREECLSLLDHFLKVRLPLFGTYQDAMVERHDLLYHSKLSFTMNSKMLSPLEVVKAAEDYWARHADEVDIAQVEGFIRQILGWREYMRGIYWAKMPKYAKLNYFEHEAPLPKWYWTGKVKMNCLRHAVGQSLETAYAHHIQRLMVTGNFALLLGVHPDEVDRWYLGIYIDAVQWVEITNTRGMSQFADGGIVGTKPYVSSANYIHKMSDYCKGCVYDRKKKHGEGACPFNSLYWDFYDRHEDKLGNNPRIGMMYRTWQKMDAQERENILEQAAYYKANAEEL